MDVVTFQENAVYNVDQTAEILHCHPQTIRRLCRSKRLPALIDAGGFRISGWIIRAYVENRLPCTENQ